MRQRVALARTLSTHCELLLGDEPFAAIDFQSRIELENTLWNHVRDQSITCIFVTHDLESAIALADRIIVMPPQRNLDTQELMLDDDFRVVQPLSRRQSPKFADHFANLWKKFRPSNQRHV